MIELIIAAILFINPVFAAAPAAQHFDFNSNNSGPQKIANENVGVKLTASNFIIQDVESNKILYGKNFEDQVPIASVTKLMTALVFLQTDPDWERQIELKTIDETYGAYPHIYRGEIVSVKDLFNTVLISSDNNSVKALVRISELTEKEFIEKMNQFAEENNLENTFFDNVTGLSENNISSAQDIATLLLLALEKEPIAEALKKPNDIIQIINKNSKRKIYSTNQLLYSFLNSAKHGYKVIGGKTGYLPQAGGCLAVVIEKDKHQIVSVVLGSQNRQTRFQDTKALVDWVFLNYIW